MAFGKFGKYYPGGVHCQFADFDLVAALREDFDMVVADRGAGFEMSFNGDVGSRQVRTDRQHLQFIAVNLLHNALKYSNQGGRVDLLVSASGPAASFSVADVGIGIPEADLAELFSPFYRASNVGERPGTGMGLAIVKKSARLIGARVTVASQLHAGTRFVVTLNHGPVIC